ncbi:hypothetical protein QYF36_014279 [Acer negundo]|nr:hypothetical protein QYF36_009090 [Acer negundo]KAK4853768.1 hypothetical protein QYF36_014279 [Acer negundo]
MNRTQAEEEYPNSRIQRLLSDSEVSLSVILMMPLLLSKTCLILGVRAVVRNAEGLLCSVELGELLDLREGLLLAKDLGFKVSWVDVNAANVASGLNGNVSFCSDAGLIFDDVKGMFEVVGKMLIYS